MKSTFKQISKLPTKARKGFSLVEMVAVIVLIGIVAGLVAPRVFGQRDRANQEATKVRVQKLAQSIESYAMDNNGAPSRLEDLLQEPGGSDTWAGPYAKESDLKDAWGKPMIYKQPGEHGEYDIVSYGKDGQVGGDKWNKDIVNWE